ARAELIKLRHDLTSGISPGGPRRIVQRTATVQNLYQGLARTSNTALDRAHRAFADRGRVLIGKAARAHKDEGFTLFVRQVLEGARRIGEFGGMVLILAAAGNAFRRILVPGRLPPGAAAVRIELVAQDGEQPGLEVGAGNEAGAALPRLDQRF